MAYATFIVDIRVHVFVQRNGVLLDRQTKYTARVIEIDCTHSC